MKNLKYLLLLIIPTLFYACDDEEEGLVLNENSVVAPSEVNAIFTISDDNTGTVTVTPSAVSASSFEILFGDVTDEEPTLAKVGETLEHVFAEGNYTLALTAVGSTGLKASVDKNIVIAFDPPANLAVAVEINELAVVVTPTADDAFSFEVYFGEDMSAEPVQVMPEETATYTYAEDGSYEIRVVAIGAAIATSELTQTVDVAKSQVPLVAAPTPTVSEGAVVSIYSDAYTDVTLSELPTEWSGLGAFEEITVESDNVWKLSDLDFLGIVTNYATGEDLSAMTTMHIDYWVPEGTTNELFVKIVNTVDGGEAQVSLGTTVADSWQSIEIPITEFDAGNLANKQKITQILIDSDGVAGAVYIDNFYFYNENGPVGDGPLGLPLDFSSDAQTFGTFNGASFTLESDPSDPSNQVGNIMNVGAEWEGATLALEAPIDLSTDKVLRMRFFTINPNSQVLLKLENGDPAQNVEVVAIANDFGWNELSFDFTEANGNTVNASGTYTTVVVFVDGPLTKSGSYLIDDIEQSGLGLPLDFNSARQTMGTFNGAAFEIVADLENADNRVGQITNGGADFEGMFLALEESVDLGANGQIIKLDFYAEVANTNVLVKLEAGTDVDVEVLVIAENQGWNELTFDFSAANGGTVDATGSYSTLVLFADLAAAVPGVHLVDDIRQLN